MESLTVSGIVFSSLPVRGGTHWYFLEVSDPDGYTGVAEFTSGDRSLEVARTIAGLADEIRGVAIASDTDLPYALDVSQALLERDRVLAAAMSALRSAMLDAQAQRAGVPMWELLNPAAADGSSPVRLYGNINRSMLPNDDGPVDRSPEAFAKAATRAVDEGFTTVKCAPFDECRAPFDSAGLPSETANGLARVAAVREAVGEDVDVFVDCHSRFDLESSLALRHELERLGVDWYEEPVAFEAHRSDLAAIRSDAPMLVAGAETAYGERLFKALMTDRVVDVVMPDVKYCGGVGEAFAIGRAIEPDFPGGVSIHAPAGPIALLGSAHATRAFGGTRPLEHAIYEVDWRSTAITPAERIEDGCIVIPDGSGLGASLNQASISQYGRRWTL